MLKKLPKPVALLTITSVPALLLALSGCEVGPNYHPPRVDAPPAWDEQSVATTQPTTRATTQTATTGPSTATTEPVAQIEWWKTFRDPMLNALIERAARANLDVRQARERVIEARAQRSIVRGDWYPQLGASTSYQDARISKNGVGAAFGGSGSTGMIGVGGTGASAPGASGSPAIPGSGLSEFNFYQLGFDSSWEIDLFGGTRRAVEAAGAKVQSAVEDQHGVLLSLFGEVARNYIDLRLDQRRLELTRENLDVQKRSLSLAGQQFQQGLTNQLDVARAKAEVASTAAQIPMLEAQAARTIHLLSVMIDEPPTALMKELSEAKPLPPVPATVPIGLPSDLLRRRPDIRHAERELAAASANIGVATAALYPKFSLTSSLGLQSIQPGHLLDYASRYYSIGPAIEWNVFGGGQIRGRIAVEKSRQRQAMLTFERTVLGAFKEVDDALVTYSKAQQQAASLQEAVSANEQSVRIASDLYSRGLADFLSVLDADRSLYASQDALAQSQGEVAMTLVALYKSLGGGWEIDDAAQPGARRGQQAQSFSAR